MSFKELINGLQCSGEDRQKIIASLRSRIDESNIQNSVSLNTIKLTYAILNAADLKCKPNEALKILNNIKEHLSYGSEFYKNVTTLYNRIKKPLTFSLDDLEYKICDDNSDLMQCGTDVDSCQRYEGSQDYNKCLMAYSLDGKYLIAEVKNKHTGKIIGRAMLRLLWDNERNVGVIHLEKVYHTAAKELIKSAIKKMSISFAEKVGFDLVRSKKTNDKYSNKLESLYCPAPYEYVDGAGGVKSKTYFVEGAYWLYKHQTV